MKPSLSVQRWSFADWQAFQAAEATKTAERHLAHADPVPHLEEGAPAELDTLGALGYGLDSAHAAVWTGDDKQLTRLVSPLLSGNGPLLDVWRSSSPLEAGRSGQVHWWRNAEWLFGTVDLDEHPDSDDLTALSHSAYSDIFKTLNDSGRPHLLRIWNYLPRINLDGGGMERYRQFNAGRQRAFLEAERPVFEGSPAACALGTPSGPLSIRFLAGCHAPVAIENPRQVSAYRYPSSYGPRAPTFSRAALADMGNDRLALLISGTASIVGHASVHPGDVAAQTQETLRNLQAVIDSAHTHCSARFDLRQLDAVVYVRRAADEAVVRQILMQALGAEAATLRHAVFLQADICRTDLLMEIEAHALATGALNP